MAFSAIVLDNKKFFETGKITVRVAKYYNSPMVWDLTDDTAIYNRFKEIRNKEGKPKEDGSGKYQVEDFDNCLVSSPLGGGRNYGLFALPQINSVGKVSFLDNSFSQPIWEGSFWRPVSSNKTRIDYVNIPNDQPLQEGKNADGAKAGNNLEGDEGTIILRTKTTTEDEYDWEQNNTENLVVLDKNKLKIIHFLEWSGNTPKEWQEISIENGEVSIKIVNDTDSKTANFLLKEDEMLSELDDSGEKTSLKLSTSDPSFEFSGPNNIKFFGDADYLAKYNDLVDLMDRISSHKHVCPVNGMTAEVLDGGAPMGSSIKSIVQSMKAERLKVE